MRIGDAAPPEAVAPLLRDYLTAHLRDVGLLLGVTLPVEDILGEDLAHLDQFAGPRGCLLIARRGDEPLGCVGLRPIGDGAQAVGEIKRLYVTPAARGLGVGRGLMGAVMARALYADLGFRIIPPYGPSPVPADLAHHWICMALDL